MNVTRFEQAPAYFPPNHFGMQCRRLQGHEAGPADALWLGVSTIFPGGHTTLSASDVEKHYVVLAGVVTVETQSGTEVLNTMDSCRLAPGEKRAIRNDSAETAMLLLAMPLG
ncbi:hypothetical protein CR51_41725 [Caballeronia megalochromosomata]|nr:hypothetical protein CR51_41725 [Caballeronia megalochromosomata]